MKKFLDDFTKVYDHPEMTPEDRIAAEMAAGDYIDYMSNEDALDISKEQERQKE